MVLQIEKQQTVLSFKISTMRCSCTNPMFIANRAQPLHEFSPFNGYGENNSQKAPLECFSQKSGKQKSLFS